jgi:hypothetical protein
MELGAFPYLMMAVWTLFLPPLWWSWLQTLPRRSGVIARLRSLVGKLLAASRPNRSDTTAQKRGGRSWAERLPAQSVVALALCLVVLWNVQTVGRRLSRDFPPLVPHNLAEVMGIVKLTQYWSLFVPHPFRQDRWLMVVATLRDGSQVDLFREGRPVDWTKPEHVGDIYKNPRWRKYTNNLVPRHGRAYAEMHVRRWNANRPDSQHVQRVEIIRMIEMTQQDLTEAAPRNDLVWKGTF